MKPSTLLLLSVTLLLALPAAPQQARPNIAASASTAVPPLIPYSGVVSTASGAQSAGVTFLIYKEEQGGEPLFTETQTVGLDATGHYKAQLGATLTNGIPMDIFATGEARWLEVQVAGEAPQLRVLLMSVPYALKAADAATLGGLPASAFALAGSRPSAAAISTAITPDTATNVTTTGGVAGYVPEFSGASSIVDSPLFVSGAKVGIGTAAPLETLDVRGTAMASALIVNGVTTLGGALEIAPVSFNATPATGYNSQLFKLLTSAYNSASKTIVNPRFVWQATVNGNNTVAPSATLELLSATTAAVATPTGFYFNPNGTINFAPGQTFPGAGVTGTVSATSVNANSYNLGGSLFAIGSISSENAYLGFGGSASDSGRFSTGIGWGSLAVNAGIYNTALGIYALASNTTGNTNTASGAYALDSNTTGIYNTASGGSALISNTTGSYNTASGVEALDLNSTGSNNTASGLAALLSNRTGSENTASGESALLNDETGSDNTAFGAFAGPDSNSTNLSNSTAIGANAVVSESNALVLGQTTAGSPGATHVNVGIGTPTPRSVLEASVGASGALGPSLTLTNTAGGLGASASIDFNTYYHSAVPYKNPTSRIAAIDDNNYGNTLVFLSKIDGADTNGMQNNMQIEASGDVTIFGSLHVNNTITAGTKSFRVDDPIDPANKYLVHASVESSEQMNIYTGNVVTDELGFATVKLPDWFEAENADFRYQLTTIGRQAQAWIAEEVSNGQFKIATNATRVKVSWQITAVRQDAYAKANPLVVEQPKPEKERGSYVHPELYGQPVDRQIGDHAPTSRPAQVNKHFATPDGPAHEQASR